MLPVIKFFKKAHDLADVTVVADAGMISAGNHQALEDARLSFILGTKIPEGPYAVKAWRNDHPDTEIPDGHVFVQPWPATQAEKARGKRDALLGAGPRPPPFSAAALSHRCPNGRC